MRRSKKTTTTTYSTIAALLCGGTGSLLYYIGLPALGHTGAGVSLRRDDWRIKVYKALQNPREGAASDLSRGASFLTVVLLILMAPWELLVMLLMSASVNLSSVATRAKKTLFFTPKRQ